MFMYVIVHLFSLKVHVFDFADHPGVDHFLVKVTSRDQGSTICSITSVQDSLVCDIIMLHLFSLDLYCVFDVLLPVSC